jgi:hypothetical protein
MKRKPLSQTNPYLKNPKLKAKMIHQSVVSSTAIEGVNLASRRSKRAKKTSTVRSDKT